MLCVQFLSTSRSNSSIHHQGIVGPVTCTAQYKRHSSNGTWSPYFFISPDLPPIYALQVLLEKVHAWTHLPWFVFKHFHTYIFIILFFNTVGKHKGKHFARTILPM